VEVLGIAAIQGLLDAGQVVLAGGGGGIAVARTAAGDLEGVEAVIDKDWTTSLIARRIGARRLINLTAVASAFADYRKPSQRALQTLTVREARALLADGHFAPGSMGPKVESCCDFVEAGGEEALITSIDRFPAALRGEAGTRIAP
jgi:carbamate kinase